MIAFGIKSWMLCRTIPKYDWISPRMSDASISSRAVSAGPELLGTWMDRNQQTRVPNTHHAAAYRFDMFPQTLHVHGRALPLVLIKRKFVHILPDHTRGSSAAPASPRRERRRCGYQRARPGRGSLSAEKVVQERLPRLPRRRLRRVVVLMRVVLMRPERQSRDDGGGGAADGCP